MTFHLLHLFKYNAYNFKLNKKNKEIENEMGGNQHQNIFHSFS